MNRRKELQCLQEKKLEYIKENLDYVSKDADTEIDLKIQKVLYEIQISLKEFIINYVQEKEQALNDQLKSEQLHNKQEILTKGETLMKISR